MTLSPLAWLEDKGCDSFWSAPKCQIARIKDFTSQFFSSSHLKGLERSNLGDEVGSVLAQTG